MKLTCLSIYPIVSTVLLTVEYIEAKKWKLTKVMSKPGIINHHISTSTEGNFLNLIKQSTIWVDKSMLIKRIWESANFTFVIFAPPGWGKTINLSMLKFYLELNLNDDGSPCDKTTTESYQYFVFGKICTNGTVYEVGKPLISGYKNDYHLGRYPVIYLNGSVLDMEEGVDSIRRMICESYQLHKPFHKLLNKKSRRENNSFSSAIEEFETFFRWNLIKNASIYELAGSISKLCYLLNRTYHQKPIILFDNYDAFIRKANFSSEAVFDLSSEMANEFNRWFKELKNSTFKNNKYSHWTFITSVLRVPETYFDDFNSGDSDNFALSYGILKPELLEIAQIMKWNNLQIRNISKYHGGYYSLSLNKFIYPTYSIAACTSNIQIDEWALSYSRNFLTRMLKQTEFWNNIIYLLREFGPDQCCATGKIFNDLRYLPVPDCEIVQKNVSQWQKDVIFSVLFSAGMVSCNPSMLLFYRIPNMEIWNYLKDQLVVSLGLEKHQFSNTKSFILHYTNNQDDLNTLPSMAESISKSLFNYLSKNNSIIVSESFKKCVGEHEYDLPIEALLQLIFQNALQLDSTLLSYKDDKLIMKTWNDIYYPREISKLPLLFRNCTVLSLKLKYCHSDEVVNIQEAFIESLSYSRFLRSSHVTRYPHYKFLAICITKDGRVDAMSLSISSSDLLKMMTAAEKKLDRSADGCSDDAVEKRKLNYEIWKNDISEQTLKTHSSCIVHSFCDPYHPNISNTII